MKKSKKQRKIETAKRIAKETAVKKTAGTIEVPYTITSETVSVTEPKLKTNVTRPELYIVLAAVHDDETGEIFIDSGGGHFSIKHENNLLDKKTTDGFVDNHRNFHDRMESAKIAYEAGQCSEAYINNGLLSTSYKYIGGFSDNFS